MVIRQLDRRSGAASGARIFRFGGWARHCAISVNHAAVYRALLRRSGIVRGAILLALDSQSRRIRFCPGDARLPPAAAGDSHGARGFAFITARGCIFLSGGSLSGVHAGNAGHTAELEVAGGATVVVLSDPHLGWGHRGVLLRPGLWKTSHGAAHQSGEKL